MLPSRNWPVGVWDRIELNGTAVRFAKAPISIEPRRYWTRPYDMALPGLTWNGPIPEWRIPWLPP